MRTAPPVKVALSSCTAWRAAGSLLAAAAAASLLLWAAASRVGEMTAGWALFATGLAAASAAAAWAWRSLAGPSGTLQWDGGCWLLQCRGAERCVRPELAIDLGDWVLLRLLPQAEEAAARLLPPPEWVTFSARRCGASWHGLRVALLALPPQAPPATAPP